jgi:putative endonuclease
VLERRWRSGRGELDLVLRAGRVLVVVEVRTRSGAGDLRGPYFSISRRKWQVLRQTVSRYVQASAWRPHAARLDVVGVQGTPDGPEPVVTHWANVGALGAQWRF